ncbi:hypothetical protein [Thermoflexus sp.]|uniref:hypothetical protein n=1 Tax=Thermoflexus sp. TaxID=1969742 RepID=UPI0025F5DEB1|nr:hypothetical protein [Thermoflexus sp.]MDW8179945.1 hypothetical protein [Anaerolineae bacterium]MCS6963926.1 hypothetical protein [Thermoflexus sp.]MCS7350494.1 hypothetical protein [Thermoflexus sp.]MCX7690333.1 hypothetical protein [Thermoflexus sp.]MDW8184441.1 hypothetical protein [Anaerolineae bacterium]
MFRRVLPAGFLSLMIVLALLPYVWPQPTLRQSLTELGSTLLAYAAVVGFLSFLEAHFHRVGTRAEGWPYSLVTALTALGFLLLSLAEGGLRGSGVAGPWTNWLYQYGLLPLEASIGALLPFFMVLALWRLLRTRRSTYVLLFVAGVLTTLIIHSSGTLLPVLFGSFYETFLSPLAIGGIRGILIGVAIGVVVLMARTFLWMDRPMGR